MSNNRKQRTPIKQPMKIRAVLQQEIGSVCPICNSNEVGHFQIHHIDEDPSNNDLSNLILICPTCHSKITKGEITQQKVVELKGNLINTNLIECASISIDSKNCTWKPYDDVENAFYESNHAAPTYPIFNFSLINHTPKTILLKRLSLHIKSLPKGISGIPSKPRLLKSIALFEMNLPKHGETTIHSLENEIEVPAGQAFKFQIKVISKWKENYYPIDGREVLYFRFMFNSKKEIMVAPILLNCIDENEKMVLYRIS